MGYDSVLARTTAAPSLARLEEYIIYHPHQALARYLITCGFRRGPGPLGRGGQRSDMCTTHAGEPLRMWCLQCSELVCALCLFGKHKGHPAKNVDEVASRERDLLQRCDAILERTIDQRQRDLGELEKMRAHYSQVSREAMARASAVIDDLKGCLDARYQELLAQVEGREGAVEQRLSALVAPLQDEAAQLTAKQQQLREALDIARHPRPAAQAEFLSRVTDLHNSLNTHPKFDEAPDVTPHAPSISLAIDGTPVYEAIRQLRVDDASAFRAGNPPASQLAPTAPHPLGTVALRPEGLLLRDDSLDTAEARLEAVEKGHIWVVPNRGSTSRMGRHVISSPTPSSSAGRRGS